MSTNETNRSCGQEPSGGEFSISEFVTSGVSGDLSSLVYFHTFWTVPLLATRQARVTSARSTKEKQWTIT